MTIRLRLTLLFVALLVIVGLVRTVTVLGGLSSTLREFTLTDGANKIQEVQDYLVDLENEISEAIPGRHLDLRSPDALPRAFWDDGAFIQLTSLDGQVFNRSANLGSLTLPTPTGPGAIETSLPLPHLTTSSEVLLLSRPLKLPRRGVIGWIQVAYPLQGIDRTLRQLATIESLGLVGSTLLALAIGYGFAGRALAPVAAITAQVRGWGRRDLHRRLRHAEPPRDEIDQLASTFNDLFNRLEATFAAQQRFVADASHELKSPLTAIRGHLQLLQRRGHQNPTEARAWLETALREVDRLGDLVQDLLELARSEGDVVLKGLERLDWAKLVRDVVQQYAVVADRLSYVGPDEPLWVDGVDHRLRQVLINVLDNALRATRDGGTVSVSAKLDAQGPLVRVQDTGHGIPPEALPRIFDRFYRVDPARDRQAGGSGLGLAIALAIMHQHGGTLEVDSQVGVGTSFTMRLPARPAGPGALAV